MRKACWILPVIEHPYQGIRWIHPLKQKAIEETLEHIQSRFPQIYYVVIFGSTVNGNCRVDSDIDMVIWGDVERKYYSLSNDVYDVLHGEDFNADSLLWQSVLEEGVVVYDKGSS